MKGPLLKIRRRGKYLSNNTIGLVSKDSRKITDKQLQLLKLMLLSFFKNSQFFFVVQPNLAFTFKGILNRMGKGKGKIKGYYTKVYPKKLLVIIKTNQFTLLNPILKKFPFLSIKHF